MAVLRSIDGSFFEVPDDQLEQFRVPPERVKELLRSEMDDQAPMEEYPEEPQGGVVIPGGPDGGTVVINIYTGGPNGMGVRVGGPPQPAPDEMPL